MVFKKAKDITQMLEDILNVPLSKSASSFNVALRILNNLAIPAFENGQGEKLTSLLVRDKVTAVDIVHQRSPVWSVSIRNMIVVKRHTNLC